MKKQKKIKIVNKSNNELPAYATEGSAGMDLRASIDNGSSIVLMPMDRKLISTGIYIQLPIGSEAQIRPRSGLAAKHGLTVLNTPGTIDSDYRGEIKIILINLSNEQHTIKNGDRIAQMIISKHERVELKEVDVLDETIRSDGGFGHTGVK